MVKVRCPHCGSPAVVRGSRWECGWCGDFGNISSLRPADREKLRGDGETKITVTYEENEEDTH